MFKKIIFVISMFAISIMSVFSSFAIGTENATKYLTRDNYNKMFKEVEDEVDTMHTQYRKGVWKEVLNIYNVAQTSPYSAGDGIIIATSSGASNAQWTITKIGEKITKIPSSADGGIDTSRSQLMFMTPKYSRKSYVAKLMSTESPHRNPTTGEKLAIEGKIEVVREDKKARITFEMLNDVTKFSSYTNDDGSTWSGWHNDSHLAPLVHCTTAADKLEKQIWIDGFDLSEGTIFTVIFDNRQGASGAPTLKVNDEEAKYIKVNTRKLSEHSWAKNTLIVFWYDGTDFQVLSSNKQLRSFICHSNDCTNTTTTYSYGDGYKDFCFLECIGSYQWASDKFFAMRNITGTTTEWWATIHDTYYGNSTVSGKAGQNRGEFIIGLKDGQCRLVRAQYCIVDGKEYWWKPKFWRVYGVF